MGKEEILSRVGDHGYPKGFKMVTSSNIQGVLFEPYNKEFSSRRGRSYLKDFPDAKGIMVIKFKGEKYYRYQDIPFSLYNNLVNAESVGGFFSKNIKDYYKGEKL